MRELILRMDGESDALRFDECPLWTRSAGPFCSLQTKEDKSYWFVINICATKEPDREDRMRRRSAAAPQEGRVWAGINESERQPLHDPDFDGVNSALYDSFCSQGARWYHDRIARPMPPFPAEVVIDADDAVPFRHVWEFMRRLKGAGVACVLLR